MHFDYSSLRSSPQDLLYVPVQHFGRVAVFVLERVLREELPADIQSRPSGVRRLLTLLDTVQRRRLDPPCPGTPAASITLLHAFQRNRTLDQTWLQLTVMHLQIVHPANDQTVMRHLRNDPAKKPLFFRDLFLGQLIVPFRITDPHRVGTARRDLAFKRKGELIFLDLLLPLFQVRQCLVRLLLDLGDSVRLHLTITLAHQCHPAPFGPGHMQNAELIKNGEKLLFRHQNPGRTLSGFYHPLPFMHFLTPLSPPTPLSNATTVPREIAGKYGQGHLIPPSCA